MKNKLLIVVLAIFIWFVIYFLRALRGDFKTKNPRQRSPKDITGSEEP